MNKTTLLLLFSGFALITQAQVSKVILYPAIENRFDVTETAPPSYLPGSLQQTETVFVDITAGGLEVALADQDISYLRSLTIKGSMDARDFKTIRDKMIFLSELDFSETSVKSYTGTEGTSITTGSCVYPENEIPMNAFYNNISGISHYNLNKVVMPQTITSIGDFAFRYCSNMNSINIPETVVTIGTGSFYDCQSLTSFFISSSVASIGDNAFLSCNCLITVDPGNLKYSGIDGVLFDKNQTNLIKYPSNISGEYIIPSSVTNIVNMAFFGCNGLTSVTIPTSVTSIGNQAFSFCSKLMFIFIPSSVVYLGNYVFLSSLCAITVDPNNPNYSSEDGMLFNKSKSELIQANKFINGACKIPAFVTKIGERAFQDCYRLTAVTIPSSVTTISEYAFNNCFQLTSVNIPASIINLGSSAFYNCNALTSIYANSFNPVNLTGNATVFYGVDKTACTLYVPAGSVAAYASANQWSDFTNIVETTTGLNSPSSEAITVYPNPVINSFSVSGLTDTSSITLTDLNGKLVLSQPVTTNESISVSNLAKGMYILKISNARETRQCKVVKN